MERVWEPEQLIACWTLDEADWQLLVNKTGATRLGFALMLKFFDLEGRFPTSAGELPQPGGRLRRSARAGPGCRAWPPAGRGVKQANRSPARGRGRLKRRARRPFSRSTPIGGW
jgi:hypothetical protein